jgi:phage shock protein A
MTATYTLILVAAALAALAFWKRAALRRMLQAARAPGASGQLAGTANPMALFQQTLDDGLGRLHHAKKALEDSRSLLASVQRQVESGQREKARLESRIAAALQQGDPNNAAKEYALQLAEAEKQLAMNREQLAKHEETCRDFAKQIEIGQKRLMETRRKAEDLGIALEQSQHERELAQFASDFNAEELQARVAPAEELVQQQIDQNRAAGRVAADLAGDARTQEAAEETEREAEAAKILERFKKSGK